VPKVSDDYRAARRQQILDAAVECFSREGFHRTSMQDIFAESGLSAGAVYRYFRGKDEIVEAIAVERHAHEQELITAALDADDLRAGMHQLVHAYFAWLRDPAEQRRRRLSVQLWSEALRDERIAGVLSLGEPFRSRFRTAIEAAQARGTLEAHLDPDAVARVMQAVVQGFVLQQAWEPDMDVGAYVAVVDALVDNGGFG
jgi:AcrR family transcriptional regulator